ncbi:Paraquat-inducible protein B [Tritonibacter multivorans]|uniref:Paraquat-inducible protein B n=1 Tax=Tritonibacter multivorans TaxID=928856 RepID=A0A0P1GAN4_9RHOB|nr:Paraquat-inducible protein B [Tritonibacter multivorans]SFD17001.1 paraquat-inducible protein B [Tritonibacter multivorans]
MIALLGTLGLAWQSYSNRDVPITVAFEDATGIEAGKTKVRFRDVEVGTVSDIALSDDLAQVLVTVGIHKDMAHFLDADTQFWLTTAQVDTSGLTGLNTLFSGAFISVDWDAAPGAPQMEFTALPKAPTIPPGAKGIAVTLVADTSGSIAVGAPVLHKGVKMGKVEAVEYDAQTDKVLITAFVTDRYKPLLNTGTRFWNASGIQFDLGQAGFALQVDSLASLLQGGVAFDTTLSGGDPLQGNAVFDLYSSETEARGSLLNEDLRATVFVTSQFEGSVKGLKEGAEVLFRGLKVGEVQTLSALTVTKADGAPDIQLVASYSIQPTRLGLKDVTTPEETMDLLAAMVEKSGLRARLAPNSILSGGLHIELFEDPTANAATLIRDRQPYAQMPTLPTPPSTLETGAQDLLTRVSSLPVEEVLDRAIQLMSAVNIILADPDTKQMPASVNALVKHVDEVAQSDAVRQLPADIQGVVLDIKTLLDTIETANTVNQLVSSVAQFQSVMANVSSASDGLPQLMADIDHFVQRANQMPIEQAVSSANDLLVAATALVGNPDMGRVPAALSGALDEINATLDDLRKGGVTETLSATLQSASTAADSVAVAAADLPDLTKRLDALATSADAAVGAYGAGSPVNRDIRKVIADLRDTVRSIDVLVREISRKPNSLLLGR